MNHIYAKKIILGKIIGRKVLFMQAINMYYVAGFILPKMPRFIFNVNTGNLGIYHANLSYD